MIRFGMIVALVLALFAAPGCVNKEQTIRNLDTAIAVVESSSEWMDAVERVTERVEIGALPWQTAWAALKPALPGPFVERVQTALAAGEPLADALRPALAQARLDREAALAELAETRQKVLDSPDPVTSTLAVIEGAGTLLTVATGSGAVAAVVGGIVAMFRALKGAEKRGMVKGASETAAIVETGKAADPELRRLFQDDTPAARAMRAALANSFPQVVAGIDEAKRQTKNLT